MGRFITSSSRTKQTAEKGVFKLGHNELYLDDDGVIYIAWRLFRTDNFTWVNSSDWDIRCAHIHDVGCKYHQVVEVLLTEDELIEKGYLRFVGTDVICLDIPSKYLFVRDVSGTWINNLFYRMLRDADCPKTPKYIQIAYRLGVCFNVGWFFTGKNKIDLDRLYEEEWNEYG